MNAQDTIKSTYEIFFEQNEVSKKKIFDCVNNTLKNCNGGEIYFENTDFETLYFADSRIQNISQNSSQGFGLSVIPIGNKAGVNTTNLQFYGSGMSNLTYTSSAQSL